MKVRKKSADNRQTDRAEEAGRQTAEVHFLQNGRLEPAKVRGVAQNRACAERWNELAGKYPSWFTHLVHRHDGWWIINAPLAEDRKGAACDCGPYLTRSEAHEDAQGMRDFAKYHDNPGYMTGEGWRNG